MPEPPPNGEEPPPNGAGTELPKIEEPGAGVPNAGAGVVLVEGAGVPNAGAGEMLVEGAALVNGEEDGPGVFPNGGPIGGFWLLNRVPVPLAGVVAPAVGRERLCLGLPTMSSKGFFTPYFFASLPNIAASLPCRKPVRQSLRGIFSMQIMGKWPRY